jgi:hypothetical protein
MSFARRGLGRPEVARLLTGLTRSLQVDPWE